MIITIIRIGTCFHDLSMFDCYDPSLIHWTSRNRKKNDIHRFHRGLNRLFVGGPTTHKCICTGLASYQLHRVGPPSLTQPPEPPKLLVLCGSSGYMYWSSPDFPHPVKFSQKESLHGDSQTLGVIRWSQKMLENEHLGLWDPWKWWTLITPTVGI